MEIISGRSPVDYSRPPAEVCLIIILLILFFTNFAYLSFVTINKFELQVNLVDWLKMMVTNRNPEGVLDPKLTDKPPSRALKKTLLVALRCVDPNALKRPKMGQVVHMLEAEQDSSFRDVCILNYLLCVWLMNFVHAVDAGLGLCPCF